MEAKDLVPIAGVYEIGNAKTGRVYVGQSHAIQSRWTNHFIDLSRNKHPLALLQNDFNEYGPDAFTVKILEESDDRQKRLVIEAKYVQKHIDASEPIYNASGPNNWQNHDESEAKAARDELLRVKTQARTNETLQAEHRRHKSDGKAASGEKDLRRDRAFSGQPEPVASVASPERKLHVSETDIRAGKEGSDKEAKTERPSEKGLAQDRRLRESEGYLFSSLLGCPNHTQPMNFSGESGTLASLLYVTPYYIAGMIALFCNLDHIRESIKELKDLRNADDYRIDAFHIELIEWLEHFEMVDIWGEDL